jgi:four helix bundle protein
MNYAKSFKDLVVYQKQRSLALEVFRVSKDFPRDEKYSLTDQLRRASRSIGAQIAEAWAKRRYEKHFVAKLTDADGEQQETQHWLQTALDCGYVDESGMRRLTGACEEIGRLLARIIECSGSFCQDSTRTREEPLDEYFAN